MDETISIDEGITFTLTGFSHKYPMKNGPTKATAYVLITNEEISEEITFSIHGIEGVPEEEDGLTKEQRYDTVYWGAYIFELKKNFDYGNSITLDVSILESKR